MKTRLSKRAALRMTASLWRWLSLNTSQGKESWPGWTSDNLCVSACPCCEYVKQRTGHNPTCAGFSRRDNAFTDREKCPLKTLWPEGCVDGVFGDWHRSERVSLKRRAELARLISNAAKNELKKL